MAGPQGSPGLNRHPMTASAPRLSESDITTFRRDGVVALRQVFATEWLDLLRQGIDRNMAAPSPRFEARTRDGGTARYCEDFWVWSEFPEFEAFVREFAGRRPSQPSCSMPGASIW